MHRLARLIKQSLASVDKKFTMDPDDEKHAYVVFLFRPDHPLHLGDEDNTWPDYHDGPNAEITLTQHFEIPWAWRNSELTVAAWYYRNATEKKAARKSCTNATPRKSPRSSIDGCVHMGPITGVP